MQELLGELADLRSVVKIGEGTYGEPIRLWGETGMLLRVVRWRPCALWAE